MSTLFAALQSSASALSVFQAALNVTSNNVSNASTPGYARQNQGLQALLFDSSLGSVGGVAATRVESARDIYAERAVQLQSTSLGTSQQKLAVLWPVQGSFDITGASGIPGTLNQLYSAFSTWATTPKDGSARQGVLSAAQSVSQAFQRQSAILDQAASTADIQLSGLVGQVNRLATAIQQNNIQHYAIPISKGIRDESRIMPLFPCDPPRISWRTA